MSSEIRKYELKARAESQRQTRERIARAAAELHEEVGVARTTVAEIARRAEVTRLTVYNHFPDLGSLLPACSAHYETLHPRPDLETVLGVADDHERVVEALRLLYGWYRDTEALFGKAFSDRSAVPELDEFLAVTVDVMQRELSAGLARSLDPEPADAELLLRLAADFWTWRRLDEEGLDDEDAARFMARTALR